VETIEECCNHNRCSRPAAFRYLHDDAQLTDLFKRHLKETATWIASQPNMNVINANYNELLENPFVILSKNNRFLGDELNLNQMAGVVDKSLHRQVR